MNELQIFENPEFGKIRAIEKDGEPWFVAADVCRALGLEQVTRAMDRLDDDERGLVKVTHPQSPKKTIDMNAVNESGLYHLVLCSNKPEAKSFKRWITHEVIPSIRKTGSYSIQSANPYANMVPKSFSEALFLAAKLAQENEALKEENEVQRQVIADYQPKVDYYTTILQSTDTMTVTQIAADYGLTAHKLNKILHDEGVQRKVGEQWVLYRNYMGNGYTKSETVPIQYSNGNMGSRLFTKWSQKGRLMIHEILTKRGIKAIMDLENEE